jgi:hypothetical protein
MQGARRGGRRSHGARTATRTDAVAGGRLFPSATAGLVQLSVKWQTQHSSTPYCNCIFLRDITVR